MGQMTEIFRKTLGLAEAFAKKTAFCIDTVALKRAFEAAKGLDVRLGGGSHLIRQYLRLGLVDEIHLVLTSKLLGAGERLFDGTVAISKLYECVEYRPSETVTHVRLCKRT